MNNSNDLDSVQAQAPLRARLARPRLRRWEASEYLAAKHGVCVAPATLAKLANVGGGPAFHRYRRIPLYPTDELDLWARERMGRLVRSTSEPR